MVFLLFIIADSAIALSVQSRAFRPRLLIHSECHASQGLALISAALAGQPPVRLADSHARRMVAPVSGRWPVRADGHEITASSGMTGSWNGSGLSGNELIRTSEITKIQYIQYVKYTSYIQYRFYISLFTLCGQIRKMV